MFERLKSFHRFFASQSFYPLVLSSTLAMVIYTGRVIYGRTWNYNNLVWNLFLAWLPYLFSMTTVLLFRLLPRQGWMLIGPGALWLLFFPNAPYIVTDFLHLDYRPPIPLWYDIGMLAMFAWTGCFLAIASLRSMQYLVSYYLGKFIGWIFAILALGLGGLGIYLGRFARWNSWDLLFAPKQILKDILIQLTGGINLLRFVGFTVMFTSFLVVCYLMFISIAPFDRPEQRGKTKVVPSQPATVNRKEIL